jgi:protein-S-isoprenylcysteine O-methyltransferase Ste14
VIEGRERLRLTPELSRRPALSATLWHDALDWAARAGLILLAAWCGEAVVAYLLDRIGRAGSVASAAVVLDIMQATAALAFNAAMAVLAVIRLRACRAAPGVLPRLAAVAGTFILFGLSRFSPAAETAAPVALASLVLLLAGNALAAVAMVHLGRSFSIMAEARRLVTGGPYRVVRHPIYVAETIGTLGLFLVYRSWPAVAVCASQIVLQLIRAGYEEDVLRRAFPDYADYASRVPAFVPGLRRPVRRFSCGRA